MTGFIIGTGSIASPAVPILFLLDNSFWGLPCVALILLSFVQWSIFICAACSVCGAWSRRFGPAGT